MKTTKKQIDANFIEWFLPAIKDKENGIKDKPLRTETYNNYIDSLHKDGIINDKQVNRYCIPKRLL